MLHAACSHETATLTFSTEPSWTQAFGCNHHRASSVCTWQIAPARHLNENAGIIWLLVPLEIQWVGKRCFKGNLMKKWFHMILPSCNFSSLVSRSYATCEGPRFISMLPAHIHDLMTWYWSLILCVASKLTVNFLALTGEPVSAGVWGLAIGVALWPHIKNPYKNTGVALHFFALAVLVCDNALELKCTGDTWARNDNLLVQKPETN